MTPLVTPSAEELSERRRSLRKQRRVRNLQNIWRVLAISGLAAGAFWLIRNPFWLLLHHPDQVVIDGNKMLTDASIHELLALEYPQRIFDIEPEALIERLSTQAPIDQVWVSRQLFPPRMAVVVQERLPVAVTIPSRPGVTVGDPAPTSHPGLIDDTGQWMAQSDVGGLNHDFAVPKLQVRGFHQRYQRQWPSLYQALQTSSVNIHEVDWRSPNNLILHTEIGEIHCGVYEPQRLLEQLALLPQLRSLTNDPKAPAVDYVDLTNPQVPSVKLSQHQQPTADSP
ncbi:MAG: FtsQ-type POTRA domain-containing protein [Cyanobacteria bacterium P01_C01_bin.120]